MCSKIRFRRLALATFGALLFVTPMLAIQGAEVTYEHDSRGRVSKATYSDGTIVDYSYDANGNRTGATVTPGTQPPTDTTLPGAPGTPSFSSITGTSATANWTEATDNVGVTGYDYRLNAGGWQSIGNVVTTPLTGLTSATSYTFSVRARDAAGNLGPASSGNFMTSDGVAPSVPTNVAASSTVSTTVNVSWAASTDNVGVAGYRVFRNGSQIGTSVTTSYVDGTVSGSTSYSYRVSAYDAANNSSAQSTAASVTTPDTIPPTAPTSLSASAVSTSQINLSWGASTDVGGSGLAGYRIYRGGSFINSTSSTSYSDTGLATATAYSYTVASYDQATNTSAQSDTASATTWTQLTASVSAATWRWRKRGSNPVNADPPVVCTGSGGSGTGYTYAWQFVSGDTATTAVSPNSNSTIWSRNMLGNGTYSSEWRCVVADSAGNSAYSGVSVIFTKQPSW